MAENVHSGYRVLQEYFATRRAFLLSFTGATSLPADFPVGAFTLRLHFNLPLPVDIKLRKDSLRLYCTPVVNLFAHHSEPVRPDDSSPQYALRASQQNPEHYDVFGEDGFSKVAASDKTPGPDEAIHIWPEFEGFQHQIEYSRQREVVYWHHRTRTSCFIVVWNTPLPLFTPMAISLTLPG